MTGMTLVIAIAGALSLLGAILLWRGWRGRRLGDHPYCRRCGFNLFGSAEGIQVCTECGADVTIPGAIVIGVRQRRGGLIGVGAMMLVPTLVILLAIIIGSIQGVDWNKRKPAWWLAREGQSIDKTTRDAAIAELNTRFAAGTLSSAETTAVIDAGLKYQGRADQPWSVGWGDLIEAAERKGVVSEAQWKTYAEQAVAGSMTLRMRDKIAPKDLLAYRLTDAGDRVGRMSRLQKLSRVEGLVLDGVELMSDPANTSRGSSMMPQGGGGSGWSNGALRLDPALMEKLGTGTHTGFLRVDVKVAQNISAPYSPAVMSNPPPPSTNPAVLQNWIRQRQAAMQRGMLGTATPPLADVELKLPVTLECVAAGQAVVRRIDDDKLRRDVADAISVISARIIGGRLDVELMCPSPPTDLSFVAFIRDGKKETEMGHVAFARDDPQRRPATVMSAIGESDLPTSPTVELVLRPDPTAAKASPFMKSYWGGEVVIKNVRLEDLTRFNGDQQRTVDALLNAPSYPMPSTRPLVTVEIIRGLLLKIETLPVQNGAIAADAVPIATRELLIYPDKPFSQRIVEGGTTTAISGVLHSGANPVFTLELRYIVTGTGRGRRESLEAHVNVNQERAITIGRESDSTDRVTVTVPK